MSSPAFHCLRLATVLAGLAAEAAPGAIIVNPWQPLFKGVEFATAEADVNEPLLQKVQALRVDLRAPGIEIFSTPSNGDELFETTSQTTSEFVAAYGVQAAVNANFYSPCCTATPFTMDLWGLAVSRGQMVSPPETSGLGTEMLMITKDNLASIDTSTNAAVPLNLATIWTAVAGSDRVLRHGVVLTNFPCADLYTNLHPRTAAGLSAEGRYLIVMTIDGRQPGYSIGVTMAEVGAWLQRFGAEQGLNLDGGGSTTMVKAGASGPVVLNRPSGGALRSNGNNLGVYARAYPPVILSAIVRPDGHCCVLVRGEPGTRCAVEASTDLAVWQMLTEVTLLNPTVLFCDRQTNDQGRRYYRTRLLSSPP